MNEQNQDGVQVQVIDASGEYQKFFLFIRKIERVTPVKKEIKIPTNLD
jgi:hypothetical protein